METILLFALVFERFYCLFIIINFLVKMLNPISNHQISNLEYLKSHKKEYFKEVCRQIVLTLNSRALPYDNVQEFMEDFAYV